MPRPSFFDRVRILKRFVPDPFLLWLIAAIGLATLYPARDGLAQAIGWISVAMVVMLFFFHGAKLARDQIVAGLIDWRLHLVILASTFGMFPLVGSAGFAAFPHLLPHPLWIGVLFVCALPSTVQSAIAFVAIARGNVPSAIASASASQMLGILLTPILVGLLAGGHSGASAGSGLVGIGKVAAQILLPFLAGHLCRPWLQNWIERHRKLIGWNDRGTIIVAVYSVFSASVLDGLWHRLPLSSLSVLLAVDALLLGIALGATWGIGRLLGFRRADRIAILFCGTKKSLVQGVPMARVLFAGPDAGLVLLPLMLFHQMQLMACAFIARRFAGDPQDA